MIRRILLAYDGSSSAKGALSIACSIARITRSELFGLFVMNENRFVRVSLPRAIAGSLVGEAGGQEPLDPESMLNEVARAESESLQWRTTFEAAVKEAGVDGTFIVERGEPSQVIVDRGRATDMIIMGKRGRHSGEPNAEDGVTVHGIVKNTTRPVLVVPEDAQGEPIVVLAYDESAAAERALRAVAEFAFVTSISDVHLVTVTDDVEEGNRVQARALEYLQSYELNVTRHVSSGKPHEVLRNYCQEVGASIVALGAFGKHRFLDQIFGSTADSLLGELSDEVALLLVA